LGEDRLHLQLTKTRGGDKIEKRGSGESEDRLSVRPLGGEENKTQKGGGQESLGEKEHAMRHSRTEDKRENRRDKGEKGER